MSRSRLWLVVVLLLSACVPQQDDYVQATINGKPLQFRHQASGSYAPSKGPIQHLVFSAALSEDESQPQMSFNLQDERAPLRLATYTAIGALSGRYFWQTPAGTVMHHNGGKRPFSITLTRLDRTRIEGSFHGTLLGDDDTPISVADGRFSVPVADN
jgi:hypothetical protein